MIRYYITGSRAIGGQAALLDNIARQLQEGVDFIQIREKHLPTRALLRLLQNALALPNPHGARILVNERMDVCLAAGAHGVHLPSHSIATSEAKRLVGIVGVSCHSVDDVVQAEAEGADYVLLSPIFFKPGYAAPLGLDALQQASQRVRIPVFALGGVTADNAESCVQAGAQGIAGIGLFQT